MVRDQPPSHKPTAGQGDGRSEVNFTDFERRLSQLKQILADLAKLARGREFL